MAKFNVVQKHRRAAIADRKRAQQGDPFTKKLKQKPQPLSISGKRKRKLLKKWRREQKEAVDKGLITMQDVEMAIADADAAAAAGTSQGDANKHPPIKFHIKKKSSKLKVRQLKTKDKNRRKSDKRAAVASTDTMEE